MIQLGISLADKVTAPAKSMANAFQLATTQSGVLQRSMAGLEAQATKAAALGDVAKFQSLSKQYTALDAQVKLLEKDFPGVTTALADQATAAKAAASAIKDQEAALKKTAAAAKAEQASAAAAAKVDQAAAVKAASNALKEHTEATKRNVAAAQVDVDSSNKMAESFAGAELWALKAAAALGAVAIAAVGAGAALAISASDFKQDTLDAFQALTGSAQVGKDTLNVIRDLEREVPDTEASLVARAKNLLGQGLDPKELESTLRSMSDVATAIGEEGAQKIQNIVEKTLTEGKFKLSAKQLVGTGVTEEELAKQLGMTPAAMAETLKKGTIGVDKGLTALNTVIENKLGGIASKQVGDFDVQIAKFKDTFSKLFEDVDAGPFLDAMHDLLSVFDQANPSGQALKAGITGIFNGLFSVAGKVIPYIKTGFLHLIILGLQLYIALKPHLDLIKTALLYTAIAVGLVVGALAILVGSALAVTAGFAAISVAAAGLVVWIGTKLVETFWALDKVLFGWAEGASDIATKFIEGLVGGIKSGAVKVVDSVKELGSSMLTGVKDVLGIHSPSVEMMKLGVHTATGFAQGIAAGNDNAVAASAGLGSSALGAVAPSASSGGGGVTVTLAPGAIVIQGGGSADENMQLLESGIVSLFERIALSQGVQSAA